MPQPHQTDEQLLIRHREGDPRALSTLLERHRGATMTFLVRSLGQRQLAEEVFVDTWLAVHRAAPRWEPRASFRAFLFRIARNRCISAIRKRSVRPESRSVSIEERADPEQGGPRLQLIHGGASPQRQASARRQLAALEQAIEELPENRRSALLLMMEGLSYPEVAESLGVPLGTVKTWIFQARKQLKAQLGRGGTA